MSGIGSIQSQVFRPLPDVLRADAIVDRLTTAISLGLLRQGEQLPVENRLTALFGVATATVRDALQTLRESGIIETRRGRSGGTFIVRVPETNQHTLQTRILELSMSELRDLEDEQVSNGLATIRLALERGDPSDFDRLERIANQMGDAKSSAACVRADSRFHIELAVIAQSERLMATAMRLLTESVESLWSVLEAESDREWAVRDHLAIATAMRNGDLENAQTALREHIRRNTYRVTAWRLNELYPAKGEA